MRVRVAVWLAASAAGAALLALPDDGDRLVAFSGAHGLTALDAAGVALLLAGWLPLAIAAWRRRAELARATPPGARRAALVATGAGAGLVVAGAFRDFEGWWVVGAALLLAVQLALLARMLR